MVRKPGLAILMMLALAGVSGSSSNGAAQSAHDRSGGSTDISAQAKQNKGGPGRSAAPPGQGRGAGQSGLQRNVGQPRIQRNVGQPRIQRNVGQPGLQRNVGQPRIQRNVGQPRIQRNVGQPRIQRNVGQPRIQRNVGQPRIQRNVGQPRIQRNVGQPRIQRNVGQTNVGQTGRGLRAMSIRGASRATIGGRNYSIWRDSRRVRRGGNWRTFVGLSTLGALMFGSAYYYPYAYIDAPAPYCEGLTEDGCQLQWREVPTLEGPMEYQCVAYCPWQ